MEGRIAIVSDIHGNLEAFEEVLEDIGKSKSSKTGPIKKIVCLGDVVGYGGKPKECLDLAIERCETVLMGNHEREVGSVIESPHVSLRQKGVSDEAARGIYWTIKQLLGDNKPVLFDVKQAREYVRSLIQQVLVDGYDERAKNELRKDILAGLPKAGMLESKTNYGQRVVEYMLSEQIQKMLRSSGKDETQISEGRRKLDVIDSWSTHQVIDFGKYVIFTTHDNPLNPGDGKYVIPPSNPLFNETSEKYSTHEIFDQWDENWPETNIIVCGHLHDAFIERDYNKERYARHGRIIANPGSIGVSRGGTEPSYLVLNPEAKKYPLTTRKVKGIDWKSIAQDWKNKGLVDVLEVNDLI